MRWCLVLPAIIMAFLGIVVLLGPAPQPNRKHLIGLVRGCAATLLLVIAASLVGLAQVVGNIP